MRQWTIGELSAALRARRLSPVEVTQEYLARTGRLDPARRAGRSACRSWGAGDATTQAVVEGADQAGSGGRRRCHGVAAS